MLSVIVPSYNHKLYIEECLDAIAAVTGIQKEIIIIDDGSTDGSPAVIQMWAENKGVGQNIRLVQRENRGLVATLNEGLYLATGEYVYIVASDDIPNSDGIMKLLAELYADPELKFVIGNAEIFSENIAIPTKIFAHNDAHVAFFKLPSSYRQKALFLDYPSPLLIQATIFRTKILREIGGWNPHLVSDDYSLFIKLFSIFPDFNKDFRFFRNIIAVSYRQHEHNSFRNSIRQAANSHAVIEALCPEVLRPKAFGHLYSYYAMSTLRRGGWGSFLFLFKRGISFSNIWLMFNECIIVTWRLFYRRFIYRTIVRNNSHG